MRPGPNDGGTIKHVLLTIAEHPGTSGEIARKAQVSMATSTKMLRRLLDENLVHVSGRRPTGFGAGTSVYAAGPAPGTDAPFDLDEALRRLEAQAWQQERRRAERRAETREVKLEQRENERRRQELPAGMPQPDPLMAAFFGRAGAA